MGKMAAAEAESRGGDSSMAVRDGRVRVGAAETSAAWKTVSVKLLVWRPCDRARQRLAACRPAQGDQG